MGNSARFVGAGILKPVRLVRVARVLKAHGVKGLAKCALTTDFPDELSGRGHYLLCNPNSHERIEVTLESISEKPGYCLMKFKEFSTPEELKPYHNWDLGYPAPPLENREKSVADTYLYELQGLEVRNGEGVVLGVVTNVVDSGPHFLLEVDELPGRLIPFTQMYTPVINPGAGYLVTTYPLDQGQ